MGLSATQLVGGYFRHWLGFFVASSYQHSNSKIPRNLTSINIRNQLNHPPFQIITIMTAAWKAAGLSYNRYTAVAARVLRRALKEEKRIIAERRGESELRYAKWTDGKQGDVQHVNAPVQRS